MDEKIINLINAAATVVEEHAKSLEDSFKRLEPSVQKAARQRYGAAAAWCWMANPDIAVLKAALVALQEPVGAGKMGLR